MTEPTATTRSLSFRQWLQQQRDRNDFVGDFAVDASDDLAFPRYVRSFGPLRNYLLVRGACREARCAAALAIREWRQYRSDCRKPAV